MCTFVILRRHGHEWPVIVGANRDEMIGRPWQAPARHWPDRPEVVAGLDLAITEQEDFNSFLAQHNNDIRALTANLRQRADRVRATGRF